MLNKSGVVKSTYGSPKQILSNVALQASVGCVVPATSGVDAGGKKIVKAGTPLTVDLKDRTKVATAATDEPTGVLLHDVDVTNGNANGQILIFGFVQWSLLEEDVQTLLSDTIQKALEGKVWFVVK